MQGGLGRSRLRLRCARRGVWRREQVGKLWWRGLRMKCVWRRWLICNEPRHCWSLRGLFGRAAGDNVPARGGSRAVVGESMWIRHLAGKLAHCCEAHV